jgi:hypothetical protein
MVRCGRRTEKVSRRFRLQDPANVRKIKASKGELDDVETAAANHHSPRGDLPAGNDAQGIERYALQRVGFSAKWMCF